MDSSIVLVVDRDGGLTLVPLPALQPPQSGHHPVSDPEEELDVFKAAEIKAAAFVALVSSCANCCAISWVSLLASAALKVFTPSPGFTCYLHL